MTAKSLSCEWLERMQVGEQVCGEEGSAGISRMPILMHRGEMQGDSSINEKGLGTSSN